MKMKFEGSEDWESISSNGQRNSLSKHDKKKDLDEGVNN